MSKWFECFEIKNETPQSADLYFYGDIVSDLLGVWQDEDQYPAAVKDFLSEQEGKDLNIYINSGGGSVFAGLAIYNMIQRKAQKNKVQVYVDGLAGSIASVIAFAGSEPPKIPANAFLMIHNPWTYGIGNAEELRKMANDLDIIREGMAKIYEQHMAEGVTIEDIKELMDDETWLTGEEASLYFDVDVTEVKEYAAASGDYLLRMDHDKIPKGIFNKPKTLEEDKALMDIKHHEEEMRNGIIRTYISTLADY